LTPDHISARFNLGLSYLRQKEWQKARSRFEGVLALQPGHAEARYRLACIDFEEGNLEQALRQLQSVLLEYPEHSAARYQLALTYRRLNQPEQAQAAFQIFERSQAARVKQKKMDPSEELAPVRDEP